MLATILADLGREEKAKAETAEALRLDFSSTVSRTSKSPAAFKPVEDDEYFFRTVAANWPWRATSGR